MVRLRLVPGARATSVVPFVFVSLVAAGLARGEPAPTATGSSVPDGGAAAKPGVPPPKLPWEDQIAAFEQADKQRKKKRKPPPIVFMGSSSIRLWESLGKDFPYHHVVNRGFGGAQLSDSVRFAERILTPHKPALVVLYAGTNDIDAGKSPITVASDFRAFTAKVWSLFPETHIAFISIGPSPLRWKQAEKVQEANRLIAAACDADPKLHFVDVFPDMLGDDGKPRPDLYVEDQLHMSRKGYELWIPRIRKAIDKIVPPARLRVAN